MPSPFPGMDPYLEGELWGSFHAQYVSEIARQLAPRLRPRYIAFMEKRFVTFDPAADDAVSVSTSGDERQWIIPDVSVVQGTSIGSGGGSLATAAPLRVETLMPGQVPQHWVEIRDTAKRRLVTVIEVLCPANKSGEGRKEYLERRRKVLTSTAHLLEIDLLRRGHRPPMREKLPDRPYFVFLSRAGCRPVTDVWPVRLDESLPLIPVPLTPPDLDVALDLQACFASVYDHLGFDLAVNYSRPAEVRLLKADQEWAARIINQKPTPESTK
ncbi:MAG TPA: DUF4058 family protein [Tepidisphaeraceae bacterium]|nr:DUF4058 family protein [Tepidisphaeraceae bacterium]